MVWSNLIGNAVHYSDYGGTIKIRGAEREIAIWNACRPLSEEQISRIFEAFYRLDFARASDAGGTGLGLYIVKEILEANGASYRFCPEGQGMCFSVKFPAENPGAPRE
ncbi:MAG: ATP-binding protein [Roseburia sp.]